MSDWVGCRVARYALVMGTLFLGLGLSACAGSVDDPIEDAGDETDSGDESDAADAGDADADGGGGDEDVINRIEIDPESAEIVPEESVTFEAEAFNRDDEEIEDPQLTWESDAESVATVSSESGQQVDVVAEDVGTAIITVRVADDSGISASAQVDVVEDLAPVDRVEIEPDDPSVEVGDSVELEATAFDEDDNELGGRDRTWSSDDEEVATVDEMGVVTGESEGTASISVEIEEVSASVDVEVTPENTPPEADAGEDQTVDVGEEVTLDATASSDAEDAFDDLAFSWSFSASPSGGDVDITDADSAEATFEPSTDGTYEAEVTVTDTAGAEDSDTVEISVEEAASEEDCLIISEYVEGSGLDKALEIYNCGGEDLQVDDFGVCLESNDSDVTAGDGCSQSENLSGTLGAGETFVFCDHSYSGDGTSVCDQNSALGQFNGDDRLFIYEDTDDNDAYDHGTDTVVDAFGDLGDRPDDTIWEEVTYDRCDFTPHDGAGGFEVDDLYTEEPLDTFSGLGQAPSEGC